MMRISLTIAALLLVPSITLRAAPPAAVFPEKHWETLDSPAQHGWSAAEVPPHIARGHLLAAFCGASPATKAKQVTAIYRAVTPAAAPPGSYTTVAFTGGYVGLAGNRDATGGSTINFSIWGKDATAWCISNSASGRNPSKA